MKMETGRRNPSFIFTVIVFVTTCGITSGNTTVKTCPKGEVRHEISGVSSRCCKPWPYNCPINHPYTVCEEEGGYDVCTECKPGYIQPNLSNSSSPAICYKPRRGLCDQESIPVYRLGSENGPVLTCECDRANHFFSIDFSCDSIPSGCAVGQELQVTGSCAPCQAGSFKNWTGNGLCIPWTNCAMQGLKTKTIATASTDNVCDINETVPPKANMNGNF